MTLSNTRLAVRRNPHGKGWLIVSPSMLPIWGFRHGEEDAFPGRWVYPFSERKDALYWAHRYAAQASFDAFIAGARQQLEAESNNEILASKATATHTGFLVRIGNLVRGR